MTKQTNDDWKVAGGSASMYNPDYENASFKPEKVGEMVEGLYMGKREHIGENDSTAYSLIDDKSKKNITVWESAVIKTKFSEIPVGSKVQVEYIGKPEGKKYYNYEVRYLPPKEEFKTAGASNNEEIDTKDIPF